MVKHVVTTSMVPHLWAQQDEEQGWAKSGKGSISYDGKVLISYSTVIARFVEDINDETVVLISKQHGQSRGWGNTTGRQISEAARATSHRTQFTELQDVGNQYTGPDHQANLDAMIAEYREDIAKQKRVMDFWRTSPASIITTARNYARRFGLEMPAIDENAEWAEVVAILAERERKRNTPQAIAKRERDAERRAAKRTLEQQEKAARRARERAEYEERQRLSEIKRKEQEKTAIIDFRSGKSRFGHCSDNKGGALIRVVDGELQTSHGARVPLDQAIKVFKVAFACRRRNEFLDAHLLNPPIRVGNFKVDQIRRDGTIRAGCHTIHWPEIERCAVSLGLIEAWSVPGEPRMAA